MNKKLETQLVKKFPLLYSDHGGPMQHTCMHWGFDCFDGWYDLIHDLSVKLEAMIVKEEKDHKPDGFHCRAAQVKEKYGELCFYMTSATDEMYDAIDVAEALSGTICEICGKPGKIQVLHGWFHCLCDGCSILRDKHHSIVTTQETYNDTKNQKTILDIMMGE